jgi:hypothetical protein
MEELLLFGILIMQVVIWLFPLQPGAMDRFRNRIKGFVKHNTIWPLRKLMKDLRKRL